MMGTLDNATYKVMPFKELGEAARKLGFSLLDNVDSARKVTTVRLEPFTHEASEAIIARSGIDDCDGIEVTTSWDLDPQIPGARRIEAPGRHMLTPAVALQESAVEALRMASDAVEAFRRV